MRCIKLFYNCDRMHSCIALFAGEITDEKCFKGEGECEFRQMRDDRKMTGYQRK